MTMTQYFCLLAVLGGLLSVSPAEAQSETTISTDGIIETDGGVRFPDDTLQETAAQDVLYNLPDCQDGWVPVYNAANLEWVCAEPPQGPPGDQGPQGKIGPQGEQGKIGPPGSQGEQGKLGPQGEQGKLGPQGEQGKVGPPGPSGADGNTVLNGGGFPPNTLGHDGDFYVDLNTYTLYGPKTEGQWPDRGIALVGPQGEQGKLGPQGEQGKIGPPGEDGTDGNTVLSGGSEFPADLGNDGDFYLDTDTNTLYGPKTNGQWPDGGTSLVGPQGEQGKIGPQGEPGPVGPASTRFVDTGYRLYTGAVLSYASTYARCGSGEIVTGGGCYISQPTHVGNNTTWMITSSYPYDDPHKEDTWSCSMACMGTNIGDECADTDFRAYAVCAPGPTE